MSQPPTAPALSKGIVWLMLAISVLACVGLFIQLILTLREAQAMGETLRVGLAQYLSYFTVLANILMLLAVLVPLGWAASIAGQYFRRPCVVTGIAVCVFSSWVAYQLLQRHFWHPQGVQLVADLALHLATPALFTVYWWCAVPRGSIVWRDIPYWLVFPGFYFAYLMLRGVLAGDYPHSFLDPNFLGYRRLLINTTVLALSFVLVGIGAVLLKRKR